ncbi:hypothetical protein DERF_012833 [Dermatophagoides farinae]|uniref:Uncharacterized protein n=1 Tax=Dermatophagoides farinae TaxID=6954 RepID=A0A922HTE2_DERFA|nr:hypothetical protein DERF_012833 [Dermatophagoides farinae]
MKLVRRDIDPKTHKGQNFECQVFFLSSTTKFVVDDYVGRGGGGSQQTRIQILNVKHGHNC